MYQIKKYTTMCMHIIYITEDLIQNNVFTLVCTYLHLINSKYYIFNVIICDVSNMLQKIYYKICYILLNYIKYILIINVKINLKFIL